MTIYAVGDIHGQSAELDRVLALIEADGGRDARIVFLGDYTDRGPDSRGVLDRLVRGLDQGRNWTCLMGNHDRMFARFLSRGAEHDDNIRSGISWFNPRVGGAATLASYGVETDRLAGAREEMGSLARLGARLSHGPALAGVDVVRQARRAVPEAHRDFLRALPLYQQAEGLLFVHAGIRPGLPLAEQAEDDLIWIRDGFLEDDTRHPWLVVHGHTALEAPDHFGNRVDLDGGAGYGRPLWAAAFEGRRCFLLSDEGRLPLEPPTPG